MSQRDTLIAWLNDAYSMEQNLDQVLQNHVKDVREHPQIQARLQAHLDETRRQADMLEQCLERLGTRPSATKSAMGKISGFFSAISTGMADDELVKNVLADYSMEHFEIASYRALIAAAEQCGEREIADVCRTILREEEEMARWLEDNIPLAVQDYLTRQPA